MTCPDAECHSNLQDLKDCTKMLKNKNIDIQLDIEKKVSRKELWFILLSGLTLSVPIFFTSAVKNVDWKLDRESKSAMNKLAIEVMTTSTQKDIASINEKICAIQKQQEQLPDLIYYTVKKAVNDSARR
jgi:hypothetical protein